MLITSVVEQWNFCFIPLLTDSDRNFKSEKFYKNDVTSWGILKARANPLNAQFDGMTQTEWLDWTLAYLSKEVDEHQTDCPQSNLSFPGDSTFQPLMNRLKQLHN